MWVKSDQQDRNDHLNEVPLAYNTSLHDSTSLTTLYLIFGIEPRFQIGKEFGRVDLTDALDADHQNVIDCLTLAWIAVRSNIDKVT